MSNAKPTVKSHFQGHELHDTSPTRSGEPEAPVSTTESTLPTSKEARDQYALGNWYLEPVQRQYSLAINAYKRALEFDPNCAAVHHSLGFAYYKEGEFDLAQEALQKAIELNPQNANYHYVWGQLLEDWTELEGAWEKAIHEFTRAIELNPSYIEAWYNRGLLYEKLEDLEKACEDFKQVVSRAPAFHAARHNLGILYIKRQQWQDAEQVFEEILEVEPREPDAHYHLAEIYLNRYSDVNRAIDCLQYAIERDPEHLDARFELGLLYAKHRYTRPEFRQQAIDQFIELIKRNNELQTFESLDRVFFVLGSLYDDRPEDADLAIYVYKTGLEHAPSPQAQNNLGLLYLQKNMVDKAAEAFKQAIQLYPDYESPYHNLAKLYFYERDEEILKDLQAWLAAEPQTAARIIFHLTLSLMDVARGEAYQSLYSHLHRVKNLISATGGQLRLASRRAVPDSELHTSLNQILTQHEECYNEMVALLQQLRTEEPVLGLIDINRILDTLLRNLMPVLEAKEIDCQQIFDTRLPSVKGDSSQLKEAFNNLIINAVDAMEDGGFLQIKTAYLPESSQIKISFIDTGVGIPYEVRDQLYQPGYTLKQHGSGFGLNIVQRTVRDHRGRTELHSEEGHGTTFLIYLPVDLEATPIQTNLQMRPIFYESPHEFGFEELV
jgi:signal transduction histidine kinase